VHIFHFNRHSELTCKMCANRHLSFVFWSKPYSGRLQLKTRDLSERAAWRFGELATVTHMGVLNARVAILGRVGRRHFYIKTHFSFYTHHKWASVVTLFRKLVTSKILSELRVPISTSLKFTFSTGCNFSTNAIRFCRTVKKNLLNMCIIWRLSTLDKIFCLHFY